MTIMKRIAILVAIIAVSARPLVKIFLQSLGSAPDDAIGEIPILSNAELASFVKGSELFISRNCLQYVTHIICGVRILYIHNPLIYKRTPF